jgi:hypothetical protein
MPGLELVWQQSLNMMENDPVGFKPTCKEVHRLTSERLDRQLSLVERARMRLHLLICQPCRNFGAQMALIRRAMRHMSESDDADRDSR